MASHIRKTLLLLTAVAIMTLAAVSAFRLSPDALALIIGVILGVVALLPLLVLLLWWSDRAHRSEVNPPTAQQLPQPPVVIVQAPGGMRLSEGRQVMDALNQQVAPLAFPQPPHVLQTPLRTWDYRVYGNNEQESVDPNLKP